VYFTHHNDAARISLRAIGICPRNEMFDSMNVRVLLFSRISLSQTDAGIVPLDNLCLTDIN